MLTGPQKSPADPRSGDVSRNDPPVGAQNLAKTRARIAAAALRFQRPGPCLLAVSKQQTADAVRDLALAGQIDFGESYLQEAVTKIEALADLNPNLNSNLNIVWHYIGQIQSNKTRPIATHFHWVHTVDRLKIAERLSEQRSRAAPPLNICIQIKLAEEPGKGGVSPKEALVLAANIARLPRLRLRGLMCIPPPCELFDEQLAYFQQCTDLLSSLNQQGLPLDTLSMGMSDDLEAAIAAGATIVRVGTAIFGERGK
jgi:pyridoxal phosphate enzyme (YggS family)